MNARSHHVEKDSAHGYLHAVCDFPAYLIHMQVCEGGGLWLGTCISTVLDTKNNESELHFPKLHLRSHIESLESHPGIQGESMPCKVHDPILGLNCVSCVECANRALHHPRKLDVLTCYGSYYTCSS